MKKNLYICMVVMAFFATMVGCTQDPDVELSGDGGIGEGFLSVDEAQAFFESDFDLSHLVETRSDDDTTSHPTLLTPGDFTPLWSEAIASEDEKLGSVDVPIIPTYRYQAIRSEFRDGKSGVYTVELTQKLVIVKDRESGVVAGYIQTLIPDRDYYALNKGDLSDIFQNSEYRKGDYSGYLLYTHNGIPARLNRYRSGEKIGGISIFGLSGDEALRTLSSIVSKVDDIKFMYRSNSELTQQ